MGQREPWRAQLAIWSKVVSAYCMAPTLGSCEGSGSSRRTPLVTGRRPASPLMGVMEVADFEEDEEMEAVGAMRRSEDGIVVAVRGSMLVCLVATERGCTS